MLTAEFCETIEKNGLGEKLRQEGRQEGRLEDAKAMFVEGDSLEKIARVTKLPL